MLVAQILQGKGGAVHAVAQTATLQEAARELNEKRVGCVVVLDAEGDIIGILSERDIVREVAKHGPKCLDDTVASAMSRGVVTAHLDETVDDCLARMTDRRIRHLPVVGDNRMIGLVSIGDLVKFKIEAVEVEAAAMRAYIATG
ncbi:MAG: CBS domain-containing protein [Hyphomonadaceae bacterium]|nr:CBS domain-containing protein [Hyphomonadaceae bacterium]